jgi:hypothetical protein
MNIFAYGWGLLLWSRHFHLWLRFSLMVEAWSYGPNFFIYGPSLVVWPKQVFLCSSLVLQYFETFACLNHFQSSQDKKCFISKLFPLYAPLKCSNICWSFNKSLRLGSYANLLKPCFITWDRNVLTLDIFTILYCTFSYIKKIINPIVLF